MEVISGDSQFPLGQGTLGSVIELVFHVEMKVTIVVTPEVGFASGDLSVDKMCQGTSQQSGGRPWVVMWQLLCCAGHMGGSVALLLQREHKGWLCGTWNPAGRPRGSSHAP